MQCAELREQRLPAQQCVAADEIIYLIDDDPNVLEGLEELLHSLGNGQGVSALPENTSTIKESIHLPASCWT